MSQRRTKPTPKIDILKLAVGANPSTHMVVMQIGALTLAPAVARDLAKALIQSAGEAELAPLKKGKTP